MHICLAKLYVLALLAPSLARATPLLELDVAYTVKKEKKNPAGKMKPLENVYAELKMDFDSFEGSDLLGKPLLSNHTEQLMKLKKLPVQGADHKTELTFERLLTSSTVTMAGLPKPFVTRHDLGVFLMNKPLLLVGDGKVTKRIEGLSELRAKATQEVKDPISRSTVLGLLNESVLMKTGGAASPDSSCLAGLEKKAPGAKWNFSREEQGVKLDYDCEFEGWAEAKGNLLVVIRVVSKKQRQSRAQPNGAPGVAETEGKGVIYFEPESQESLTKMQTDILVEPPEDEILRLRAAGREVPRNRSLMKHWSRIYPL